jgi:AP2-associated kinase
MMNRRLRERLTEAEILTIFVDVCEGVAAMHNLKPALLHRDLKVENILQSSATSYKLCDFGSSAPVARPPSTTQEIRILEADLNRHTTLQYRAPEMVDAYLRRSIDEKSDVWALGVLLYKLCYYTTPFEEHGPLAILNVQYRIPPYPVYSGQMNALIGEMLVHDDSSYSNGPVGSMLKEHGTQRPSVFEILNVVHSLRGSKSRFTYQIPAPTPLSPTSQRQPANPLDGVVSYRPKSAAAHSRPDASLSATQVREKVQDAIAPMRRGRPPATSPLPTGPSATASAAMNRNGSAKTLEGLTFDKTSANDDAWLVTAQSNASTSGAGQMNGFADSFSGTSSTAPKAPTLPPRPSVSNHATSKSGMLSPSGAAKDAFAGLGLAIPDKKAPTLGEARKTRTGLASMGSYMRDPTTGSNASTYTAGTPSRLGNPGLSAPSMPARLTPSPKPRPTSMLGPPSPRPHAISAPPVTDLTPEERFPSLEDLDRKFGSAAVAPDSVTSSSKPSDTSGSRITTGLAMRDTPKWATDYHTTSLNDTKALPQGDYLSHPTRDRPQLSRKYRSSTNTSISMEKSTDTTASENLLDVSTILSSHVMAPNRAPSPGRTQPQDWLTGDDDSTAAILGARPTGNGEMKPPGTPVLRESPSKRASYIQDSGIKFQSPKHASPQQTSTSHTPTASPAPAGPALGSRFTMVSGAATGRPTPSSPTKRRGNESTSLKSSDSSDDGPEDAGRSMRAAHRAKAGGGRQGSVHELADKYGGLNSGLPTGTKPPLSGGANLQRRRSAVYPSVSSGRTSPTKAKTYTPQPVMPIGRSASPTKRPPSTQQHRKQPSATSVPQATRMIASPSASSARSRPQSMFIHPMGSPSKSTGDTSSLTSPAPSVPRASSPGLVAPRLKAQRRSSISDMVQKYESMGTVPKQIAAPKPGPPPPAGKPDALRLGGSLQAPESSLASPTSLASAAARFPALSPSTSPVMSRSELGRSVTPQISDNANGRTSPMLMRRASPLFGTSASEPAKAPPLVDLASPPTASQTASGTSDGGIRSPSPEKPYQGVGRLIDRWQKNIAEASPPVAASKPRTADWAKRGGSVSRR